MIDFERVALLLDVVHKAAEAGPTYAWFGSRAQAELSFIKLQNIADTTPTVVPPYVEPEPEVGELVPDNSTVYPLRSQTETIADRRV